MTTTTRFYTDIPAETRRELDDFHARFPYHTVDIAGHTWRYLDSGPRPGAPTLFILAGGTTVAEVSFRTLTHLAQHNRIIAPDYPPIATLAPFFDGCLQLLDHLEVDHAVAVGGSYGGWIAQSLVPFAPQRFNGLVIALVGPPDPENSRQLRRLLWILRLLPTPILRALLNRTFSRLAPDQATNPDTQLLMAHARDILHTRVTRRDILAALTRLIDQTDHYPISPTDLADWPGRVLILAGSDDPATPPDKRAALRQLYPQAEMVVFDGATHTAPVTHASAYYTALDQFLAPLT